MCRSLNVSKAGYYAWRQRDPSERAKSDEKLLKRIKQIHKKSHGCYGRPRVHVELRDAGICVSGKRVARVMRAAKIKGKKRSRSRSSSYPLGMLPAAPNVLDRQFTPAYPNAAWVSDITQFMTAQGRLYLAVVIDCFSRKVVGWATASTPDVSLVKGALRSALHQRPFVDLLVHTDRGSQFTCREYGQFLEILGIRLSMSRKGNCWDNAVVESFFASIKVELKPERTWRTRAQATAAIKFYIENWYNRQRRHSANGYLSPHAFEESKGVYANY